MLISKAIGIWLVVLFCAVVNGILREVFLTPTLGKPLAPLLSGLLLAAVVLVVSLLLVPRVGRLSTWQSLCVGALWLCLTLIFEFTFGRLVQHQSWKQLMEAYTFEDGNVWPLVLLATFIAPVLAVRPAVNWRSPLRSR